MRRNRRGKFADALILGQCFQLSSLPLSRRAPTGRVSTHSSIVPTISAAFLPLVFGITSW